ncbi:O-antigen ligase family protein [Rhizorhabdus sp. FW153]|uniref:O-antigen ligase family protein n=1 Tax=Rhizorhabdus sp. FW153 TaxID=3400216 RepID=UPI003CEE2290
MKIARSAVPSVPSACFWALAGFLLLAFATGGGSRYDIQSLVVLRSMAALLLAFAFWGVELRHLRNLASPLLLFAAMALLILLHLVPLPWALWSSLPGRDTIVAIDAAAGLGHIWRPLALAPVGAWNAFFSLLPPIAVLIAGARLTARERRTLVIPLLLLALASSVVALLQLSGGESSPLYLYRITNDGAAVGLFANRNHQAVFLACSFPLLAVFASPSAFPRWDRRIRVGIAAACGAFFVALILVTGSRAGLLTMVVGLAAAALLSRSDSGARGRAAFWRGTRAWAVAAGLLLLLASIVALAGRAESIDRLLSSDGVGEGRYRAWGPILDMALHYFPVGSGIGSFAEVYRLDEPYALLDWTTFLRAHNDPLELLVTGGAPAMLLLAVAVAGYVRQCVRWWRAGNREGGRSVTKGAALCVILILGLASLGDYPLRTPAIACLFCVMLLWLYGADDAGRHDKSFDGGPSDPKTSTSYEGRGSNA